MLLTRFLEDFDRLDRVFEGIHEFPLIQMASDEEKIILRAEIPGLTEKDIDISITDDVVEISGKSVHEEKDVDFKQVQKERWSGEFSRSIELPFEINREKAEAGLKDGVLIISLPVREEKKVKKIAVKKGDSK